MLGNNQFRLYLDLVSLHARKQKILFMLFREITFTDMGSSSSSDYPGGAGGEEKLAPVQFALLFAFLAAGCAAGIAAFAGEVAKKRMRERKKGAFFARKIHVLPNSPTALPVN